MENEKAKLLTTESRIRLQRILSKTLGKELNEEELETAYQNLMEFTYALCDL